MPGRTVQRSSDGFRFRYLDRRTGCWSVLDYERGSDDVRGAWAVELIEAGRFDDAFRFLEAGVPARGGRPRKRRQAYWSKLARRWEALKRGIERDRLSAQAEHRHIEPWTTPSARSTLTTERHMEPQSTSNEVSYARKAGFVDTPQDFKDRLVAEAYTSAGWRTLDDGSEEWVGIEHAEGRRRVGRLSFVKSPERAIARARQRRQDGRPGFLRPLPESQD